MCKIAIMEKSMCSLALLVVWATLETRAQVASMCRPNENYLACGGCQKTCVDPEPACTAICRAGCYCPEDMVRGHDGVCVPLSKCPAESSLGNQGENSFDRNFDSLCASGEEFRMCEPCGNRTCDNPDPVCPAQCARGCFCKDGLVRDKDGRCVERDQCDDIRTNYVKREIQKCEPNEELSDCVTCEKTCSDPNPMCPGRCSRGCKCTEGLFRAPNGECVELDHCPKEDCADDNAEYTCRYPCEEYCSGKPCAVRASRCSVGCFCKSGFLKEDSTGKCVLPKKCVTTKKSYD